MGRWLSARQHSGSCSAEGKTYWGEDEVNIQKMVGIRQLRKRKQDKSPWGLPGPEGDLIPGPGPWEFLMPFNKRVFSVSFQYTHVAFRASITCNQKVFTNTMVISIPLVTVKSTGRMGRDFFQNDYLGYDEWTQILKEGAESSFKLFVLCLWSSSSVLKQLFLTIFPALHLFSYGEDSATSSFCHSWK